MYLRGVGSLEEGMGGLFGVLMLGGLKVLDLGGSGMAGIIPSIG